MAGAIGAAVGRLEAAVGEIAARRIAERPSAGGAPDLLKAQSSHLTDLGGGERPCRTSDRLFVRRGGGWFSGSGSHCARRAGPTGGGPARLFPSKLIEFGDV